MTDYKQLCAELLTGYEILLGDLRFDNRLVKRARAALAEPEPEGPTDEELFAAAEAYAEDNGLIGLHNAPDFARAVLARWGNHPGSLDRSGNLKAGLTRSPAAGEVAELARLMREEVSELRAGGHLTSDERLRAADLLERLSPPQPVPVSERLPGPGDCDAEGLCWVWNTTAYTWGLFRLDLTVHSHWLPAHALPLPS